jgi:molecular chaperone DnaK (HSP70)
LGTTSSCVAFELDRDQDRRVEVITSEQGHRTTPAWVAFGDDGRLPLIGGAAKNASDYMSIGPENIVFDARRLIGRTMEDPEVQKDLDIRGKQWPFKVHSNGDGKPVYRINVGVKNGENSEDGKNVTVQHELELTPEDISGMVLRNMKETAETYLGTKVEQAIITVPTCKCLLLSRRVRKLAAATRCSMLNINTEWKSEPLLLSFQISTTPSVKPPSTPPRLPVSKSDAS